MLNYNYQMILRMDFYNLMYNIISFYMIMTMKSMIIKLCQKLHCFWQKTNN